MILRIIEQILDYTNFPFGHFSGQLIQLATEGMLPSTNMVPHCLSTYSLELKPFIEVPRSSPSTDALTPACPPRLRHDFLLTNREAVDSYWQTLEYCHVSADRNSSLKAFPGSAVKEVCSPHASDMLTSGL